MSNPLVTFGIINCNRLFYLKSCFQSILDTTQEYPEKEIIVIDNASTEPGTSEFLDQIEKSGVTVIRQEIRDPANEFAKGLNTVCSLAKGEYIVPLQGDMQFVLDGWLTEFVNFYQQSLPNVGCITLDAQRRVTHNSHFASLSQPVGNGKIKFCADLERPPFSGAGDCMYSRRVIEAFYPWSENNKNHEGTLDSETDMLQKVSRIRGGPFSVFNELYCIVPLIPASIAIYTDSRGTNARVRGNKRYGDYWPAKNDRSRYYEIMSIETALNKFDKFPVSIEDISIPIGWNSPVDENGNWKKNPIRPESANPSDFEEI